MTFAKRAALKDPSGLFNSSLDGNVRRAIDIHEGDNVDEAALKDLIRAASSAQSRDKVMAFQSGAVDYISKPFEFEEVHARVETHLRLHYLERALKLQNERLEQTVVERTFELAEANKSVEPPRSLKERVSKPHLARVPHTAARASRRSELILIDMPSTGPNHELRGLFERSRRRILSILDDALLLTEIDVSSKQFRSGPVSLSVVLTRAIASATELAGGRQVTLPPSSADLGPVVGDEDLFVRALSALLDTAVKFSEKGETNCDPSGIRLIISLKNSPPNRVDPGTANQ